jgi:hypothetical protein
LWVTDRPFVVRKPRHVVDLDTALDERLLHVAVRQPEAQVPADGNDDDVGRETEAGEGGSCSWSSVRAAGSHTGSLALRLRSQPMQQCRSASFAAELRASSASHPTTWQNIR